jgi:hypothetical protein
VTEQPAAGDDPEPIPGLDRSSARQRLLTVGLVVVLLVGLTSAALVPRSLAAGETLLGDVWRVQVTPRLSTPSFAVDLDGVTERVRGERWPGRLSAAAFELGPDRTVVVGSTPLSADSVRLAVAGVGLRESQVRLVGWQRVHVAILAGSVEITEVVAIGNGGEVLEVVEDVPVTGVPAMPGD